MKFNNNKTNFFIFYNSDFSLKVLKKNKVFNLIRAIISKG